MLSSAFFGLERVIGRLVRRIGSVDPVDRSATEDGKTHGLRRFFDFEARDGQPVVARAESHVE
jgi:hypothetical protein